MRVPGEPYLLARASVCIVSRLRGRRPRSAPGNYNSSISNYVVCVCVCVCVRVCVCVGVRAWRIHIYDYVSNAYVLYRLCAEPFAAQMHRRAESGGRREKY